MPKERVGPELIRLVEDLRNGGFAELAGSRVEANLSVPQSVLNRALAVVAEGMKERITSLSVRIEDGDRFYVDLELTQRFVPPIAIEVFIERQPDMPGSPDLILRWRTRVPGLAALARPFIAFLNPRLPPGVRIDGDLVLVDIRPLFARAGAADLVPLLTELRVATRPQTLDLHVLASVRHP
jgi:hypothetical protein